VSHIAFDLFSIRTWTEPKMAVTVLIVCLVGWAFSQFLGE
jgi:hypothetical protein